MGCGASQAALPLADVASSAGGDALVAAAGVSAAAASSAAGGERTIAAAPGELLLAVAEQLPFVAPVAFLIGAVISAAHTAKTLVADATEFATFVAGIEAVCQQAAAQGSLAKAQGAIEQLRSALEEGLAHCQRLQVQTFAAGMLFSGGDARKFEEVSGPCTALSHSGAGLF